MWKGNKWVTSSLSEFSPLDEFWAKPSTNVHSIFKFRPRHYSPLKGYVSILHQLFLESNHSTKILKDCDRKISRIG